jgi:transposase
MSTIASYYKVDKEKLRRHYKRELSNFDTWEQKDHAEDYLIYPDNISAHLAIDEISLSKGELYTFVTSKQHKGNKKKLVAIINGTEAKTITEALGKISEAKRNTVTEVSLDMARNMGLAVRDSFPKADQVIDRFHVVKLVMEALQHIRVKYRWEAIDEENDAIREAKQKGQAYNPLLLENGDTLKELLARSRYLLFKTPKEHTANQTKRSEILFKKYPLIEQAYKLTLEFRAIYENATKSIASDRLTQWMDKVKQAGIKEFNTVMNSINYHKDNILHFFNTRATNAHAESFNAKVKLFRANLRGVTKTDFFLFRLEKIFS